MPNATELAGTLVDGLLAEAPQDAGDRVAVILNGLGRTKYEELFILWRAVAGRLRDAGLQIVEPEVGELVTSLDMAGCSLTLMWLDDELERLWSAPADTPAYRKGGSVSTTGERRTAADAVEAAEPQETEDRAAGDDGARRCAERVSAALEAMAARLADEEEELGRIDAVAGDGDHGRGMVKGSGAASQAARSALEEQAGPGALLVDAGDAWASRAGGTSGVLWGAALAALGRRLGNEHAPSAGDVAEGVREAYDALVRLGGAKPGDKTMLDAIAPFAQTLEDRVPDGLASAWEAASAAADEAAQQTASMTPRVGRARPLAERSVGTPDAGAVSFALCARVVADVLREESR